MRNTSCKTLLNCFAALAACTGLAGCFRAPAQATPEDKRIPVDFSYPVVRKDVVEYEDFTGRVDAANKVVIQAMVTGYLVKINFTDGDEVFKDDVLFEI